MTPNAKGSALPPKSATLTQRRKSKQKDNDAQHPASPTTPAELAGELDPAAKTPKTPHSATPAPAPAHHPLLTVALTKLDVLLMLVLLAAAAAVRLHGLTNINTVIFDEVHYINFTKHILRGEYFFDVNPVFGKLAVAFISKLFGFDPSGPKVDLGQTLASPEQVFALRVPSVIFGSLSVPIFYRICRLLRLSTYASVVGACFMLFDHMHATQSRIVMVDAVLVFYSCLSMLCALCLWDAKNVVVIKRKRVAAADAAKVAFYLLLTGINCGLTLSTRWTAFAAPLLIFIVSFYGVGPFCMEPLHIFELLVLYASAFAAYIGSFAAFLMQVNRTGPGDNFMEKAFRSCLKGSPDGPTCEMSMLRRIFELNHTIYKYSKEIRGKDKWGSSWFHWMLNWRGALYYREPAHNGRVSMIYVLMNPAMALSLNGFTALFITVLFFAVRYRKQYPVSDALKAHMKRGGLLFFGWIGSMLPTMVVYRSGPIYQYLPGLFFAQGLGAVGFDLVPRRGRPVLAVLLIAVMAAAFAFWSPWVYATPLSPMEHFQRRWMPKWD